MFQLASESEMSLLNFLDSAWEGTLEVWNEFWKVNLLYLPQDFFWKHASNDILQKHGLWSLNKKIRIQVSAPGFISCMSLLILVIIINIKSRVH
jgi:hypothetical protein